MGGLRDKPNSYKEVRCNPLLPLFSSGISWLFDSGLDSEEIVHVKLARHSNNKAKTDTHHEYT